MSVHKVLQEDWSEYDDKKKKHADARDFACTEEWEVDYLVKKIKKHFSQFSDEQIRKAIKECCASTKPPHPRNTFVECVVNRLNATVPPPSHGHGPKNPPHIPGKREVGKK